MSLGSGTGLGSPTRVRFTLTLPLTLTLLYKEHNDYIDGDGSKLQGVRIYTLFTYLNDVPEGGGTRFTKLPADSNCSSIVKGTTDTP